MSAEVGNGAGDLHLIVRLLLEETLGASENEGAERNAVRRHLRDLSAHALSRGERVETIVVALKKEWQELPAVRALPRREADEALARIVTLCIREYYDVRPGS